MEKDIKSKTAMVGLLVTCPFFDRLHKCPFMPLENLTMHEKYSWLIKQSSDDLLNYLDHHEFCRKKRETILSLGTTSDKVSKGKGSAFTDNASVLSANDLFNSGSDFAFSDNDPASTDIDSAFSDNYLFDSGNDPSTTENDLSITGND